MRITVKLFARAKDLAGTGSLVLDLPEAAGVGAAKAAILALCPELQKLMSSLLIAVDGHYATDGTTLTESCEVACFPPVSGG